MTDHAPAPSNLREYDARTRSTDIFGRVLVSVRDHHYIIDGPIQNQCPGEEVTPAEAFLGAVASCGVELIQVIAKDEGVPLARVQAHIYGLVDRGNQARDDVTTFNKVRLTFTLGGTDASRAGALVAGFQRRCPLYGTVSVACKDVKVEYTVEA
jgi:uncharacterized OsmC-like protein